MVSSADVNHMDLLQADISWVGGTVQTEEEEEEKQQKKERNMIQRHDELLWTRKG